MKKYLGIVALVLFVGFLWVVISFNGLLIRYPWEYAQCWYCAEIDMTIYLPVDEEGDLLTQAYGRLPVGDMMYDVYIGFQRNAIGFLHDWDGDGVTERILDGSWTCQDEQMVIKVARESVWDGQYKELVFQAVEQ